MSHLFIIGGLTKEKKLDPASRLLILNEPPGIWLLFLSDPGNVVMHSVYCAPDANEK